MARDSTVLITDHTWPDVDLERTILEAAGLQVRDAPGSDEATLSSLAADAEAIMTCFAQVTPAIIASAPALKVIARYGVGVDNIAIDVATEVAEHALALLLSLARGIVRYNRSVTARGWDLGVGAPLRRIEGQTLGILGCGRIGRRLAQSARGLGLRSVGYDADPSVAAAAASSGIELVTLDEVLTTADFISLHLPLTPDTHAFIGESILRRMKPTAFLINTARGGLVDISALSQALRERWIAGAALDVLPEEPPDSNNPLLDLDTIVLTPHVAFYSEESLQALRRRTAQSVVDVFAGREPEHVANRAALAGLSPR